MTLTQSVIGGEGMGIGEASYAVNVSETFCEAVIFPVWVATISLEKVFYGVCVATIDLCCTKKHDGASENETFSAFPDCVIGILSMTGNVTEKLRTWTDYAYVLSCLQTVFCLFCLLSENVNVIESVIQNVTANVNWSFPF